MHRQVGLSGPSGSQKNSMRLGGESKRGTGGEGRGTGFYQHTFYVWMKLWDKQKNIEKKDNSNQ